MRIAKNIFLIALELGLVSLILIYFGVRIWLYASFDSVVKDLDYSGYVEDIQSTQALPNRVFEAYEQIHHYDERTSTNLLLTSIPMKILQKPNRHYTCACVDVNYGFVWNTFDRWTVGLQLDKDVGSRKCLEYLLNTFDFYHNQIGIRNASEFYFHKQLKDLSELELLKLCLMTVNPHAYNPVTRPERVNSRLEEILSE